MKVLVTGNLGYIGSILCPALLAKKYKVTGLDSGFFTDCLLNPSLRGFDQIKKDIRDITEDDVIGQDFIIHLAGLSNDPLGELAPGLTEEINLAGTIRLAEIAKKVGVQRFVYASSQSMYGVSTKEEELDEDLSDKYPLTSYARTKWEAELRLKEMATDRFLVTAFRPSTVFGVSPRLRCDIVFNNLVACAYTTGKIEIKSDGTPWRPVVHVRDVCSAFIAGLEAPDALVANRSFNVGIPKGNFTVRQLAEAAQRSVPGSTLVFTGEHGKDSRTYQVSFKRILTELKDYFQPAWDLDKGANELVEFFKQVDFTEEDFRGSKTIRLKKLNQLVESGLLDSSYRFLKGMEIR